MNKKDEPFFVEPMSWEQETMCVSYLVCQKMRNEGKDRSRKKVQEGEGVSVYLLKKVTFEQRRGGGEGGSEMVPSEEVPCGHGVRLAHAGGQPICRQPVGQRTKSHEDSEEKGGADWVGPCGGILDLEKGRDPRSRSALNLL